jgi:hypothetical protein
MDPAFLARVTYAIDFLSTFTSTQLTNSKLTHTNASLLSKSEKRLKFPAYLTGFLENNEKKQGEHGETDARTE